jgi:hypothetical protein
MLGVIVAAGARGQAPGSAAGPVVTLPAFTVTDSRLLPRFESWRYASVPGFEVLSTAADGVTEKLLTDFLAFHRGIEAVWPLVRMNASVPACLILCDREKKFAPFVPAADGAHARNFLSLSYQDREQASIVIELDPSVLQDQGAADPGDQFSHYTSQLVHREYVHFILGRIGERVPPWLQQGLEQLFIPMTYSGNIIGFPGQRRPEEAAARKTGTAEARDLAIKAGAFFPLDALFRPEQTGGDDDSSPWTHECLEFVHLCLFGAPDRYRGPFLRFAVRASRGPLNERLFRECFGMGYADFLPILWKYTGWNDDRGFEVNGKKGGKPEPMPRAALRKATDGEVGRIRGETLRMAGRMEEAHLALIAPYQRGSRDPQLLASLGLQEMAVGQTGRALKFLEAATSAHTTRARAWAALGQLRLEGALVHPGGNGGRLSVEQLQTILAPLFAARKLSPALPEVYLSIAAAWAHSPARPTPGHLRAVDEGAVFFPYDAELICRDAQLQAQFGYMDQAKALCQLGLEYAGNESDRSRIAELARSLSQPVVPAHP